MSLPRVAWSRNEKGWGRICHSFEAQRPHTQHSKNDYKIKRGRCQTMQHIDFTLLEQFISYERLGTYLRLADNDKERAATLYLDNLGQCQMFHSRLHWLEIGLRNAMNRQLTERHGQNWFDDTRVISGSFEQQQVQKAKDTLLKDNKPIHNADIVAALNFGLWVNLFNKPYENLWRTCLRKAFPHCPNTLMRKDFREKLHPILRLRNRIAHYEPIIGYDLSVRRENIIEIIGWIEPKITELL